MADEVDCYGKEHATITSILIKEKLYVIDDGPHSSYMEYFTQ